MRDAWSPPRDVTRETERLQAGHSQMLQNLSLEYGQQISELEAGNRNLESQLDQQAAQIAQLQEAMAHKESLLKMHVATTSKSATDAAGEASRLKEALNKTEAQLEAALDSLQEERDTNRSHLGSHASELNGHADQLRLAHQKIRELTEQGEAHDAKVAAEMAHRERAWRIKEGAYIEQLGRSVSPRHSSPRGKRSALLDTDYDDYFFRNPVSPISSPKSNPEPVAVKEPPAKSPSHLARDEEDPEYLRLLGAFQHQANPPRTTKAKSPEPRSESRRVSELSRSGAPEEGTRSRPSTSATSSNIDEMLRKARSGMGSAKKVAVGARPDAYRS